MRSRPLSSGRGASSGKPSQAERITPVKAVTRGGTPCGESDGRGGIQEQGTEWNFATQF